MAVESVAVLATTRAARLRRLVAFSWGSGVGLVADLFLFSVLVYLSMPAFFANIISSAVAITITYLLVSRHSFRVGATWRTYAAFVAWYATSALITSSLISIHGAGQPAHELLWKAAIVPFTFSTNFLFGRWLFGPNARKFGSIRLRVSNIGLARRSREKTIGPRAQFFLRTFARPSWRASAAIVLAFFVFIFPLNDRITFWHPTEPLGIVREWEFHIFFALALLCLARWAIRFVAGVLRREDHYRTWLLASGLYLAVLIPFFIALYPGHWVQDEFDTVYGATHYVSTAWQGYLTNVYYAFCLYLLPSAVGIVVVQMCFVAVVAGYAVTVLREWLHRKPLAFLILLPLLTPAVLLNDFYPLRLTPYGYLLVLVLTHLLRRARVPVRSRPARFMEFFAVSCGIAVLAFWRSEGIATLLLFPLAFWVFGLGRSIRFQPGRVIGAALAGAMVILFSGWLTNSSADPHYQTTAVINPMSTMIQGPLAGPNTAADLRAINAVISLKALRTMPSYVETPALFSTGLRPGFVSHLPAFNRAYLDLVVHNPGPFLSNRWDAFLAANSQTSWVPQVAASSINGNDPVQAQKFEAFEKSTLFGQAWNLTLKYQTARHLFLLTSTLGMTLGTRIFWNAIPAIVVSVLLLGYAIVRRRWSLAVCATVVVGSAALVFLTEPASYFMYFVPVFLCGGFGAAAATAVGIDRLLQRRMNRVASSAAAFGGCALLPESVFVPARPKVLLAIPAYNCAPQIGRVIGALDAGLLGRLSKVVVIDNVSSDGTADAAALAIDSLGISAEVWRNDRNYGLGGSHKVAFDAAIRLGMDYVAIVHGDDQADPADLHILLDLAESSPELGAVLGGRFQRGSRRSGYSRVRTAGNVAINAAFSIVAMRRSADLGSGMNLFRVEDLRDRRYQGFDDGLTFNIDLLLDYFSKRTRLRFAPISWREDDQVSNARNVRIGMTAIRKLLRWRVRGVAMGAPMSAYSSVPMTR